MPLPVLTPEEALVDQGADELLDEERVPLGSGDDGVHDAFREVGCEQLLEQ